MAFEGLTTAQLTTLQTDLLSALGRSLNATSYAFGTRNLSRAQPEQLMSMLDQVSEELAHRTDTTGGIGLTSFGGP